MHRTSTTHPLAPQRALLLSLLCGTALPATAFAQSTVDILDAFTLAKHIESKQPTEAMWDFNSDGLIDRRDVDTVALAAVRLNKGV